jgi:hypothetical protein
MPGDSNQLLVPIISAVSGLLGALIGGGATLLATHFAARADEKRARAGLRATKGEELVRTLYRVSEWYADVMDGLFEKDGTMKPWPSDEYHARALVAAYFPSAVPRAKKLAIACIAYRNALMKIREAVLDDSPDPVGEDYKTAYAALEAAAESLREEILANLGDRQPATKEPLG